MNLSKPERRTIEDAVTIVACATVAVLKPDLAEAALAAIVGVGASIRNRHAGKN